jgi:hypothetical protein
VLAVEIRDPGSEYVLNHCTKYLSRAGSPPELGDDDSAAAFRARIAEAWRFPIIGPVREPRPDNAPSANLVTFVYKMPPGDARVISVLGTFGTLYNPIPLHSVLFDGEDTGYRSVSLVVPQSELHTYKYLVDGKFVLDPINPQRTRFANGRLWSRFFTDGYLQPIVLEPWELRILYRLIDQILPFRSGDAENFLKRYYFGLNREQRKSELSKAFRLDESVGEVNAIDKLLAREEAHRLVDYRICLKQIDRALRKQNPFVEPYEMPAEDFIELYDKMATGKPIPGWNLDEYGNPAFFLYLLRRHAVTTAFSHPRYAGNVGAAGWAYLANKYSNSNNQTLFDWPAALEKPLGTNSYYR